MSDMTGVPGRFRWEQALREDPGQEECLALGHLGILIQVIWSVNGGGLEFASMVRYAIDGQGSRHPGGACS